MSDPCSCWLDESQASLEPLAGLGLVVCGYGNQGRAQALNLRDSGAGRWVKVWTHRAGRAAEQARADGFEVLASGRLSEGDLFLCLLPDEAHEGFVRAVLTPALQAAGKPGRIGVAHGFSLEFGGLGALLRAAPWVEAFLVAPCGPGTAVRAAFVAGWGIPALMAIWHDAGGETRTRALAVARAIGATRPGVLETTVRAETVVDLFGEQAVVCGGLTALMDAAFRTLTRAGYSAEMAYLECVQQVRLTAELVARHGIAGMRERISRTALYGDLTRGPRIMGGQEPRTLDEVLHEIESGEFAQQWQEECRAGFPMLARWRAACEDDPLEEAGRRVRARLLPPHSAGSHGD